MTGKRWLMYIIAGLAFAMLLWALVLPVRAQENPLTRDEWLGLLRQPRTGSSCCDARHCYRTQSAFRNGSYFAWSRSEQETIPVPDDIIIWHRESIDGEPYLCEIGGNAVCFVPPRFDAF